MIANCKMEIAKMGIPGAPIALVVYFGGSGELETRDPNSQLQLGNSNSKLFLWVGELEIWNLKRGTRWG